MQRLSGGGLISNEACWNTPLPRESGNRTAMGACNTLKAPGPANQRPKISKAPHHDPFTLDPDEARSVVLSGIGRRLLGLRSAEDCEAWMLVTRNDPNTKEI